ncbi:MAG: GIY-YIG nuclease family protein [Nitrospirota bacterium]|nr:GIY-YIG nuclease family protein [Nitrospirota bacterium]
MTKNPCVYILASKPHGTLYIGVTSHLIKRSWEHQNGFVKGFTKTYDVHRLVYYELHPDMMLAITTEKQLKRWNRAWKIQLIERRNPDWHDLWEEIVS